MVMLELGRISAGKGVVCELKLFRGIEIGRERAEAASSRLLWSQRLGVKHVLLIPENAEFNSFDFSVLNGKAGNWHPLLIAVFQIEVSGLGPE